MIYNTTILLSSLLALGKFIVIEAVDPKYYESLKNIIEFDGQNFKLATILPDVIVLALSLVGKKFQHNIKFLRVIKYIKIIGYLLLFANGISFCNIINVIYLVCLLYKVLQYFFKFKKIEFFISALVSTLATFQLLYPYVHSFFLLEQKFWPG